MISLRETLRTVPEFSGIVPSGILIGKWIASVAVRTKAFYFQLPMAYIQTTVVTVTLLLALGVGIITPWWVN